MILSLSFLRKTSSFYEISSFLWLLKKNNNNNKGVSVAQFVFQHTDINLLLANALDEVVLFQGH